jgi:DNA-binding LacI/PurR family transcriptional regulator/serine phosphatase RsbU (regulator of sigma subunit)
LTIGLLTEGMTGPYQAAVWPGIVDAARKDNVNLVCYCGGSLDISPQNPWEHQRNVLYDIARHDTLDGYIISGSIGSYIPQQNFIEFIQRFQSKPLITLNPVLETIPAVYVDNRRSMADLISHLIDDHGCKEFAFITGPADNVEAQERFALFQQVLAQRGLPLNPDLIMQGDFTRECGAAAVRQLHEQNATVDAIVAADDESALGALDFLSQIGVRVPAEVAVVGFDDIAESAVITPPLTTVSQPMYELGRTAVELLLRRIAGEILPSATILEAKLKIRQSCGCFRHALPIEKIDEVLSAATSARNYIPLPPDIEQILSRIGAPLNHRARPIVHAFIQDVAARESELFLREVDRIGHELFTTDEKGDGWHAVFFELWLHALRVYDHSTFVFADALLHHSTLIREELEKRTQGYRSIKAVQDHQALRTVGGQLANTLDIGLLLKTIALRFPRLGIDTFTLALYPGVQPYPLMPDVRMSCVNGERLSPTDAANARPDPTRGSSVRLLQPLYFQEQRFGTLDFEVELEDAEIYEILPEYVSSALHSALLIEKVQHQSAILSQANKELEALRVKEQAYLQAVKRELELGRSIQMGFLPQTLPQPAGWGVAASFMPAREVSGDFYDTFMISEDYLALVIADVSGKDVSAALFMSLIRTLIRVLSERAYAEGDSPLRALSIVNDYIINHYAPSNGRQMYATIFFGLLNPHDGSLLYCNAGHPPPLLIADNTIAKKLAPTGPAVGIRSDAVYHQEIITLPAGALLCAFTDGVMDARSPQGDFFGSERLNTVLLQPAADADEKRNQIEQELKAHIRDADPSDDITLLIVKRE